MTESVAIAVAGAGLIGKRHIAAIAATAGAKLHAVVDPDDDARDYAAGIGAAWYPDLARMFAAGRPDGVILATPNRMHVEHGLACVAAGVPTLVEKPVATDVAAGRKLIEAAAAADVPLLTGHHRRHNPLIAAARARLDAGDIGTIVAVHAMCWLMKPDDYFDVAWRREPGGGPVFINLIHDLDLLRHLVGDIVSVQASESNAVRGHAVEETAAILLRFANGALGTVSASDTIAAPWSWELTAEENPAYPPTGEGCYFIGGTHGALELPGLKLWSYRGQRSWWEPISATRDPVETEDPLIRQIRQFTAVIRGDEAPLVSGLEGLKTLAVIEAVKRAARTGAAVEPEDVG